MVNSQKSKDTRKHEFENFNHIKIKGVVNGTRGNRTFCVNIMSYVPIDSKWKCAQGSGLEIVVISYNRLSWKKITNR